MIQLALTLPAPRARRRDPATSHKAAARAQSVAPSHRNIIAAALETPGTVKDVAARTGLSQYAASKRLAELAAMGLIRLTGQEREGCREWVRE